MKIWLRINRLDISCSWTFVYNHLKEAFEQEGHEVYSDITKPPTDPEEYVEFWWTDPAVWSWSPLPTLFRVGYALSEAHSLLKAQKNAIIRNVACCDLLICPTRFAATAFLEAPLDVPIEIVPFGVDPAVVYPVERVWDSTVFRYLHMGVAQFRKGSYMVPEAFIKAFGSKAGVHLTISSFRSTEEGENLEKEYKSHPCIKFYNTCHSTPMSMYEGHHVLVSPHLSEGFGLCVPEAMATGMACLVARHSAPLEFFSSKYGWWIKMSEDYVPVSKALTDTPGFWRLPDIESLVELYRYTFAHRQECKGKGEAASSYVLQNLTWRQTAAKIVDVIQRYCTVQVSTWK